VRPATLAHREWQIRAFASALVRTGRDAATLTSLSDLVEIDAFKTGLRFFLDREGRAPTTGIADLASSLKSVARHYVRVGPRPFETDGHHYWAPLAGSTWAHRDQYDAIATFQ
jgi:hypothetical protein